MKNPDKNRAQHHMTNFALFPERKAYISPLGVWNSSNGMVIVDKSSVSVFMATVVGFWTCRVYRREAVAVNV